METKPPIAVFDLDGTLADTAPDLIGALDVVLEREGLPGLPAAEARELISFGGRVLIERGFTASGRRVDPVRIETLFRDFLAEYAARICRETRLFPGVVAALDRLDEAGYRLAVCTNKVEAHALLLLADLGIRERFAAVCGRDTFSYCKPDPRHLLLTIELGEGDAARAVMVGDSLTDIATARAAGIPSIAVTFGYTDKPVRELGADRVIEHFDDLFGAIADLRSLGVQAA